MLLINNALFEFLLCVLSNLSYSDMNDHDMTWHFELKYVFHFEYKLKSVFKKIQFER